MVKHSGITEIHKRWGMLWGKMLMKGFWKERKLAMGFHNGLDLLKDFYLLLPPYLVLLPLSPCTMYPDHTEIQTTSLGAKLCHASMPSPMWSCCLDAFPSLPGELQDSFQMAPLLGNPPISSSGWTVHYFLLLEFTLDYRFSIRLWP